MKLQSLFLISLKFLNAFCQKYFSKMGSMLQTDIIVLIAMLECVDCCWRQGKIAESQSVLVKHSVIVGNSKTNGVTERPQTKAKGIL